MPTSAEVVSKTQEILEIINTLNKYDMLPNDVKFEIEITYNTGDFFAISIMTKKKHS